MDLWFPLTNVASRPQAIDLDLGTYKRSLFVNYLEGLKIHSSEVLDAQFLHKNYLA